MVGVACDEEDKRAEVVKFLKTNKIPWPQHFDGQGFANDFAPKLNVSSPTILVFNPNGILASPGVRANQIEAELRKALGIKEPKKK